jgi:hypothetical protein
MKNTFWFELAPGLAADADSVISQALLPSEVCRGARPRRVLEEVSRLSRAGDLARAIARVLAEDVGRILSGNCQALPPAALAAYVSDPRELVRDLDVRRRRVLHPGMSGIACFLPISAVVEPCPSRRRARGSCRRPRHRPSPRTPPPL